MFGSWPKLTLARFGDTPLRLEATFILVPLLFIGEFSVRSIADNWPQILVGSAAIFLSVLLHELGHALTAKRHGVSVFEIVVGGFYGYVRYSTRSVPRGHLIRILAAGPFANLAIFLALCLLLWTLPTVEVASVELALAEWGTIGWEREMIITLVIVNLIMFVFNLIPAYPLDGGQILGLVLQRYVSLRSSVKVVSGLSLLAGAGMVLWGLSVSIILSIIGFVIVTTNLGRLRSLPPASPPPAEK